MFAWKFENQLCTNYLYPRISPFSPDDSHFEISQDLIDLDGSHISHMGVPVFPKGCDIGNKLWHSVMSLEGNPYISCFL